jgi:hypothetical protein
MHKTNFLQRLINRLAPEVFRPIPEGLLYVFLQSISREVSGICPWDEGAQCQKGFTGYWSSSCRNILCPGYRNPVGLIGYTSDSDILTSIDNHFNYSSFKYLTSDDFVPIGTFGAEIKFDFGGYSGPGGYGVGYYGAGFWGNNSVTVADSNVNIGDSWNISCVANTGVVGTAVSNPSNSGSYGPITTSGTYTGDHDTTYTVTIIDFWGYVQNFSDALGQMVLATCDGDWVDFWGEYFGLKRLYGVTGTTFETDNDYRTRIMKEITRAKGTKPVLLEETQSYFKSTNVSITEYCQTPKVHATILWDGYNSGKNEDGSSSPDRAGLMPYQFYINPPLQRSPSSKFVKDGTKFIVNTVETSPTLYHCYTFVGGSGYYGYGHDDFSALTRVGTSDPGEGDYLFLPPAPADNACLFGNKSKFSGIHFEFQAGHFGLGGTYIWEIWNGNSWDTLTVSDTTDNFEQDGYVWWKIPSDATDWVADDNVTSNIPNTGTDMFWVRCNISVSPQAVPVANRIQLLYSGSTNRGHYCATQELDLSTSHQPLTGGVIGVYSSANRDKNNIYIYRQGSWEKPLWESGLQGIIDRLKTAGTVAIINPS